MPTYTIVRTFDSSSSDKVYTVKRDEDDALSCDCMAWRMKKPGQERGCKHTAEVRASQDVAVYNEQVTAAISRASPKSVGSPFAPMLADSSPVPFDSSDFVFEPKLDGIRAIAEISPDGVKLWGRGGANYAPSFPEVTPALHALIDHANKDAYLVLDGEIVAYKNGVADFGATSGRAHSGPVKARLQANVMPAVYHAFDVLQVGDLLVMGTPQFRRREVLETILSRHILSRHILAGSHKPAVPVGLFVHLVPQSADGPALFQEIIAAGGEGIMAKRKDGLYRPGKRHPDWTKVKGVQSDTFVVIGLTKGTGWRATLFGAVILAQQDALGMGRLIEVGEAGTGFDNASIANLLACAMPHVAKGPPPGISARSDILHWLRPVLQAEIKYHARTPDGKLRFPVFKGLRRDL